jgi:hypothetical protein
LSVQAEVDDVVRPDVDRRQRELDARASRRGVGVAERAATTRGAP